MGPVVIFDWPLPSIFVVWGPLQTLGLTLMGLATYYEKKYQKGEFFNASGPSILG